MLEKYLYKLSPKHKLELFDKLVSPILNYCIEVCGFGTDPSIEIVHMLYCKKILWVKKTTQNDFIYGEFGRTSFRCLQMYNIVKYWLCLLQTDENKYILKVYRVHLDMQNRLNIVIWYSLLKIINITFTWFCRRIVISRG